MRILIGLMLLFCIGVRADSVQDKSVRWGYKVIYDPHLKSEGVRALRKNLKARDVIVLYPPEKNWKLPTGFLSISSYLQEEEIKSLNSSIVKVESAEKTHQLKLTMRSGFDRKKNQKDLELFSHYKIQVIDLEESQGRTLLTVKTTLGPEQIKTIPGLVRLIKWCTREDSNHRPSDS
jgi:hypothetical protein